MPGTTRIIRFDSATARGAPIRTPRHSSATVPSTSSVTWVISPASRANSAVNVSPVRNAERSLLGVTRARIGTEMIAAATPMRTSVKAKMMSDCTTARSHDAISPTPPARAGPFTAAIVGAATSINRFIAPTIGAESDGPERRSLRSAPAQNAGATWVSTMTRPAPDVDRRLGDVEGRVEVADELPGQRVAVGRRVEGDRDDLVLDGDVDQLVLIGHGSERTQASSVARNASTSARSRVRRIGGSACTICHR